MESVKRTEKVKISLPHPHVSLLGVIFAYPINYSEGLGTFELDVYMDQDQVVILQ